jgi:hypothetical protein
MTGSTAVCLASLSSWIGAPSGTSWSIFGWTEMQSGSAGAQRMYWFASVWTVLSAVSRVRIGPAGTRFSW